MGKLTYDSTLTVDFDDRVLAHLQLVIGAKLRRAESFYFSWRDDPAVGDGRSALDVCLRLKPDVVLMDYRLPELDGVETTAAIGEGCPRTAVVVLTATAETEEIDALYEAGAVACLTKDRELDEIVGAVRDAAGRGAALR